MATDKITKTHEEACPADPKADKWAGNGQAMLQEPSGRRPLFVTTLFCKVCGHVKLNVTNVDLPVPPSVTVPKVGIN